MQESFSNTRKLPSNQTIAYQPGGVRVEETVGVGQIPFGRGILNANAIYQMLIRN